MRLFWIVHEIDGQRRVFIQEVSALICVQPPQGQGEGAFRVPGVSRIDRPARRNATNKLTAGISSLITRYDR